MRFSKLLCKLNPQAGHASLLLSLRTLQYKDASGKILFDFSGNILTESETYCVYFYSFNYAFFKIYLSSYIIRTRNLHWRKETKVKATLPGSECIQNTARFPAIVNSYLFYRDLCFPASYERVL